MSAAGSYLFGPDDPIDTDGLRVAILVARFNADITDRLLRGARKCLADHGVEDARIDVLRVPGAWELPQVAAKVAGRAEHDAIVTLGCVIRGETAHFDFVCGEANRGLGEVARSCGVPVVFGVLTTEDRDQALARSGADRGNKGYEVTLAALHLTSLFKSMERP